MNYKPIIIVAGEPNSIFLEIFFKAFKYKKYKSPIILICSLKILNLQMKSFKINKKINILEISKLKSYNLDNRAINLIDVNFDQEKAFKKISNISNQYIQNCFKVAFNLIKNKYSNKFINGPISKKTFLNKKFLGITELIAKEFSIKKNAMLIYNKELSVCPITTHLPLKFVSKNIKRIKIHEKIDLINQFYKKKLKINPRIGVLGLNPHCETVDKFNEDEKIIKPIIKYFKKLKYNINGPLSADTAFLKKNRKNFDVLIGMYHDQVLTPIKTLFEYDAINITLGLPFIRISPDHGPNEEMLGKNKSNPLSLIKAITFLDKT
jgi:4-hydroxythreonine-4-phosphate dehydrogenase